MAGALRAPVRGWGGGRAGRRGGPRVFPSAGFSGLGVGRGGLVLRAEVGGGKIKGQEAEVMEG